MSETAPLSVHRPEGEPRGGIVVIQEAFGVNDHIEDVARRFAAEGWLAVAPTCSTAAAIRRSATRTSHASSPTCWP